MDSFKLFANSISLYHQTRPILSNTAFKSTYARVKLCFPIQYKIDSAFGSQPNNFLACFALIRLLEPRAKRAQLPSSAMACAAGQMVFPTNSSAWLIASAIVNKGFFTIFDPGNRSWHGKALLSSDSQRSNKVVRVKFKLAEIIRREDGKKVTVSTVGRILKRLKEQGKIKAVSYYYGHTRQRRARSFHGHSQRWRQGMKAQAPGELMQIDHMKVYPQPGRCVIHFKATCPLTKMTVAQAYNRATSRFIISSIQVDGGSEFRAEFESLPIADYSLVRAVTSIA